MFKKRIGNDITFTWHIYRKSGDTQAPESFDGKEVEVKLISPLQRPVTIEDVSIATGVVTFTFKGKHQVTLGNYVAMLQENKGEDGMVTLDVVNAVTLVPHSYMEEAGDEGDVIEAASVELESSISAGGGGVSVDAYTKAESDERFVHYSVNTNKGISFLGNNEVSALYYSYIRPNGVTVSASNTDGTSYVRFIDITADNIELRSTRRVDPDEPVTRHTTVVWEDTATSQIPAATTSANGLMSTEDKIKLDALPTDAELTEELKGKQDVMPITTATGATLSAVVGNYYRLDNVGTLAITLPTITGATKLQAIKFLLVCGSSALVTFAPQGSETILYQEDFALETDTTYEVTALWNGSEWTLSRVIYG